MPVIMAGRLGSLKQDWDTQGVPGECGLPRVTLTHKGLWVQ